MSRRLAAVALLGAALWLLGPPASAAGQATTSPDLAAGQATTGPAAAVVRVPVTGPIDPLLAAGVRSAVERAGRDGNPVLLVLDTPGGLDSSMREIIKAILDAPVPVIGYVGPRGARAASAGTFILAATSYAAMAPETTIGAAHPVGVSGQVMTEKVTNDAANYIRGLAEARVQQGRQRKPDWYEQAVRQSIAIPATDAWSQGVVDGVYPDEAALLAGLDGQTVDDGAGHGPVTLHTRGAPVRTVALGPGAALLHRLIDPDVAFLLFVLGIAGLVYEVVHPGIGVGGVGGGLALILALIELSMLPVQLAGVALLVGGVGLFVLDLKTGGHMFLAVFGAVALLLGGLLFYQPGSGERVNRVVLVLGVALVAALFLVVGRAVMSARRTPPITGTDALVGTGATTISDLTPNGRVWLAGADWRARAAGGVAIPAGHPVVVTAVDGLTVEVTASWDQAPALGHRAPPPDPARQARDTA